MRNSACLLRLLKTVSIFHAQLNDNTEKKKGGGGRQFDLGLKVLHSSINCLNKTNRTQMVYLPLAFVPRPYDPLKHALW